MKQIIAKGIVLSRTDYGEADRIVTLLTPDRGKLRLMVRGVRRMKSKMAGGIELFSVSDITYIEGRGEIGTMISSRLKTHYGDIVKDIDRVQLGYELIKMTNKTTEDHPEPEYFSLLQTAFESLNDPPVSNDLILAWFQAQLLKQAGHSPNLLTDTADKELDAKTKYSFDFEAMAFTPTLNGRLKADHIKALRLLFSNNSPKTLNKVDGLNALLADLQPLMRTMLTSHIRV